VANYVLVADSNVVKKATITKGLTSILDVQIVKVKTASTVNGQGCDSRIVNGEDILPVPTANNIPCRQP
jgi:hypothetical protein